MENVLEILQYEVQRKLGRCMIRLQQYERLLKTMVATMALEGPPEQLPSIRDKQEACTSNKTLGTLVGLFTGSHLTAASPEVEAEPDDIRPEGQSPDAAWARIRFNIAMSTERYGQTTEGLAKLVEMRNHLVHHFIERFDLSEVSGCRAATNHLDSCYEEIDGHCQQLKSWATGLVEVKALTVAYIESKAFEDVFVHGINPDGSVCWPRSTIVECLRGAEAVCQVDGWTSLDAAIAFILKGNRDQIPSRYGCKTWRQVLKKSGQFELRSTASSDGAVGQAWYRSYAEGAAPKANFVGQITTSSRTLK
jgi:hypothetical protein